MKRTTNLWLIVEHLQLKLEQMGLARDVVDETVTRSISALVEADEKNKEPAFFPIRAVAQA